MSQSRKQTPSDFLKQIIGRPVVVKLNSGIDYRGMFCWFVLSSQEIYLQSQAFRLYLDVTQCFLPIVTCIFFYQPQIFLLVYGSYCTVPIIIIISLAVEHAGKLFDLIDGDRKLKHSLTFSVTKLL